MAPSLLPPLGHPVYIQTTSTFLTVQSMAVVSRKHQLNQCGARQMKEPDTDSVRDSKEEKHHRGLGRVGLGEGGGGGGGGGPSLERTNHPLTFGYSLVCDGCEPQNCFHTRVL